MIDLEERYRKMAYDILNKFGSGIEVWAFGSRVTGKSHEGSDLDLVIINVKDPLVPQSDLIALKSAFSDSRIPISIDIHDWAQIPDSFREEIEKRYEVFYP